MRMKNRATQTQVLKRPATRKVAKRRRQRDVEARRNIGLSTHGNKLPFMLASGILAAACLGLPPSTAWAKLRTVEP